MARELNIVKILCVTLLAVSLLGVHLNLGYAQEEPVRPVEVTGKVYVLDISSSPLRPLRILVIESEDGKICMLIGAPAKELWDTYKDLKDREITVVGRIVVPPIWRYKGEFLTTIEIKEYFIQPKEQPQEPQE